MEDETREPNICDITSRYKTMTGLLWILLFVSILCLSVGWVLLARLVMVIDTDAQLYRLSWQGIAVAQLVADGNIRISALGWSRTVDPWRRRTAANRPVRMPPEGRRSRLPFSTLRRKGLAVLRSFRVRRLNCNLDTDNYLTNAYLYPVFGLLSGPGRQLRINFNGDFSLQVEVENQLYRIVLALLK